MISPVAVGTVLPLLRSASGLVYLSFMPDTATVDAVKSQAVSLGRMDETGLADLRETTGRAGYALASGQYIPGLCAIALPIFNHDRTLAGAITLVSKDTNAFTDDSAATGQAITKVQALELNWSLHQRPTKPSDG